MDLRLALLELAVQHRLTPAATARLTALGEFQVEPQQLTSTVPLGIAMFGSALGGLGIVFWVAANWDSMTRSGRFAILEAIIIVLCLGAVLRPSARIPLSVVALLAIGGLLAYFAQTYPSSANPWQLFALWAGLALPLCLGVRHDALWAPWALVAMTALSLWLQAQTDNSWRTNPADCTWPLAAWSMALLMACAFSPAFRRYTGAGLVTARLTALQTTSIVTVTAVFGLFSYDAVPQFLLALLLFAFAAAALCQPQLFDTFALSLVGLGLNVLLVAGMTKLLFHKDDGNITASLLLLALTAAVLLAATTTLIIELNRRQANSGVPA